MSDRQFSVCTFYTSGDYNYDLRFVTAEEAMAMVKTITESVGARVLGIVERVIITDGGDCIAFEWKKGEGVVFPPLETKI